MGGFKEGTVDDWGDEDDDTPESEPDASSNEESRIDERQGDADAVSVDTGTQSDTGSGGSGGSDAATGDIPWVLRRNSITDGREQTVQLHLQGETLNVQRSQKSIIESRLGESVRKADLREAALLVGLQHTDDVVDVLEEWGYAID